ncbi:ABC transporter permease [Paenibacillus sp. LHD-117]|uniref:ABC transporter permease n=1 Tax=Paenibacillus sp. LHD-117 TaxID=3071412 RepID=UPI0027E0C391|nr:ABC transporter permease [Paenibacillus sp. LHD-117]MDQ6419069.1 ABC transporter permease [Paenibacillus sp. LHD-117]
MRGTSIFSLPSLKKRLVLNGRTRLMISAVAAGLLLLGIVLGATFLSGQGLRVSLESRDLPPSSDHLFGTDWLGRDMFARTIQGLALSVGIGLAGAACSAMIAMAMGLAAAFLGRTADRIITWLIDVALSVPHLVMLILIAFVSGGGIKGILIGIMLTHWPSLARVIRAEALGVISADYVAVSRGFGKSRYWVMTRHLVPHLLPQLFIGFLLLFPHAVLHEAAITFLGLGFSPHQPAIGIILSESMRYLSSGMWWLAVFPGLGLLVTVRAFDRLGHALQRLIDPKHSRL